MMNSLNLVWIWNVFSLLTAIHNVESWSIHQLTMMSVEKVKSEKQADTPVDIAAIQADDEKADTFIDNFDQKIDVDGPLNDEMIVQHGFADEDRIGRKHLDRHRGLEENVVLESTLLPKSAIQRLSASLPKHERKFGNRQNLTELDIFSGDGDVENLETVDLEKGDDEEVYIDGGAGDGDSSPISLTPGAGIASVLQSNAKVTPQRDESSILAPFGLIHTNDEGMKLPLKSREIKRDWCFAAVFEQVVEHDGCESVYVKNRMCYGQCGSFFVPRLQHGDFESCSFCTPTKARVEIISLSCPGRANRIKKVDIIEECGCRPCGHKYI